MGINTLTTPSAIQQSFLYTNTAITKNDLVISSETGFAAKVPSTISLAQSNNNTAGTSLFSTNASYASSYTYYGDASYASGWGNTSAQLGNGDIVLVYPGNGTDNNRDGVNIQIQGYGVNSPIGSSIYIYDTFVYFVRVAVINSSSFVVCWVGNGILKFAIYNNAGTVITAQTTIATISGSSYTDTGALFNLGVLTNGDIVFAYNITGNGATFKRYNSTGTLQGSQVTVEASIPAKYFQVLPLASGNFVITHLNTSSYAYKFAIYDSSNTVVKSLTTISTSNSSYYMQYGNFDTSAVQLANGNIVFITSNTTNYYILATTYTSAGTLVLQNLFESSAGATYTISSTVRPGLCVTSAGFAVMTMGSSVNHLYTFDSSGNLLTGRIATTNPSGISGGTVQNSIGVVLVNNGAAGFSFSSTRYDGTQDCSWVQSITSDGTTTGTAVVNFNLAQTYTSTRYQNAFLTSDGNLYKNYRYQYGWNCSAYFICRKSIFGVAQETASANSIFKVATSGAYNLTENYAGGTFNVRANTVTGTKGSIVGAVALLQGLV
jgi:hypothetical protein